MIYSDLDIKHALEEGGLVIEPRPVSAAYATSSVDLLLGNTLTVFDPPIPGVEIAVTVAQADPEETAGRYGKVVTVAAALAVVDGVITEASVVLGGVAPTPYRAGGTEDYLRGRAVSNVSASDAGAVVISNPRPLPDNAYKLPMASNLTARSLAGLLYAESPNISQPAF